jgi:hypothetical protein
MNTEKIIDVVFCSIVGIGLVLVLSALSSFILAIMVVALLAGIIKVLINNETFYDRF